ncbi:MAG: aldo/keto reductase [Rhodoferax sp.]|nr:aldo/keto reductase [Rhodoferax sp.]MDP3654866.1 aldo/keto reductase [Rhodoferax sp.]
MQIIYNLFRQRPAELLFEQTQKRGVGVLARLPLSSGLLSGKMGVQSAFAADDHRQFNREGAAFDRGETFSGLDFQVGLQAVDAMRALVPEGQSMAQMALRWIQMHPAVTCTIPGGKNPTQVVDNVAAADLPALDANTMQALAAVYERFAKPLVHQRW